MNTVILSLGTNVGDKVTNLEKALIHIAKLGVIMKKSFVYKTPSWGFDSYDFYNMTIEFITSLSANETLLKLQTIEAIMGRTKKETENYEARIIDIDILFFNSDIVCTEDLIIPHPRIPDRKFVLMPTKEIIPNYQHPILHKSVTELLQICNDNSVIEKVKTR